VEGHGLTASGHELAHRPPRGRAPSSTWLTRAPVAGDHGPYRGFHLRTATTTWTRCRPRQRRRRSCSDRPQHRARRGRSSFPVLATPANEFPARCWDRPEGHLAFRRHRPRRGRAELGRRCGRAVRSGLDVSMGEHLEDREAGSQHRRPGAVPAWFVRRSAGPLRQTAAMVETEHLARPSRKTPALRDTGGRAAGPCRPVGCLALGKTKRSHVRPPVATADGRCSSSHRPATTSTRVSSAIAAWSTTPTGHQRFLFASHRDDRGPTGPSLGLARCRDQVEFSPRKPFGATTHHLDGGPPWPRCRAGPRRPRALPAVPRTRRASALAQDAAR